MKNRIARAALIALLCSAALARAELGPDTEVSVLSSTAFFVTLLPCLAVGMAGAASFGSPRPARVMAAAATVVAALAAGLVAVWAVAGLAPAHLLQRLAGSPLGWGAAVAAFVVTQILAWRQARGPFGRRG